METINIRTLHINTGEIVRKVAEGHTLIVTDHGNPIATIMPFREDDFGISFANREVLPDFEALPPVNGDSSLYISEDRDRG
jgi:prevent-host-death family protein